MRTLVTAVAVSLVITSLLPAASASGEQVVSVPSAIAADCSQDVSSELAAFITSVPDGSTVTFAPAGCYRVERQMDLLGKTGVVLDGQGATLVRTEPTPLDLRYPKANGFLRLLKWIGGGVRHLNIQGINVVSDVPGLGAGYGAWDQSMEFDAGINVRGGSNIVLEDLRIDGTFGDGVQIQRWGTQPTNIVVRDVTIGHNGRQGISISAATSVLIERVNILGSRRGGINLEPDAPTMVVSDVEIRNSTIASHLLAFPSQGGGRVDHVSIHHNTITRTGVPFIKVWSTSGLTRTDWRIEANDVTWGLGSPAPAMLFDNVKDVWIADNVLRIKPKQSELAVGLRNGATATIANNWFRGGLPEPGYVRAEQGSSWIGGNNSVTDDPPSPVRWVVPVLPPVVPVTAPPVVPVTAPPVVPAGAPAVSTTTRPVSPPTARKARGVRRHTKLSINVKEPAHAGDVLRARGRLLRTSGSSTSFLAYSRRTVLVQFRKEGAADYRTVVTVRTGSTGWFSSGRKLTASRSGAWRAVFKGDSRYRPSTSVRDVVRVKRALSTPQELPLGGLILDALQ